MFWDPLRLDALSSSDMLLHAYGTLWDARRPWGALRKFEMLCVAQNRYQMLWIFLRRFSDTLRHSEMLSHTLKPSFKWSYRLWDTLRWSKGLFKMPRGAVSCSETLCDSYNALGCSKQPRKGLRQINMLCNTLSSSDTLWHTLTHSE